MGLRLAFALAIGALAIGCAGGAPPPADAPASTPAEMAKAEELVRRGEHAAANGDTVRAEQYLALAIEKGADRGRVLPLLLKVCLSSSRLRAALDHAKPYLREHPEDDRLRYLVATIHLGLDEKHEARARLEELIERSPRNADAHYLLGVLASELDRDGARRHFQSYLDLAPAGRHAPEVRSRLLELRVSDSAGGSVVRVRRQARR